MCDADKFGSLEVNKPCLYALMISLEVWKSGRLHIVCDADKFGRLEIYETLHICDDDKFESLEI